MMAGSKETDAEDCQIEKVTNGRLDIDAIPKEKTCNVAKLERYSFSSQDSLRIPMQTFEISVDNGSIKRIDNSEKYLESGQVKKRQTVDQLKCGNGKTDRVIGQLGWAACRPRGRTLME